MQLPNKKELKEFEEWKQPAPTHEEHGIKDTWENPASSQVKGGNPRNWRMEGAGHLICDTDFGPVHQRISTDYICIGTDKSGLPVLKKVVL